MRSKSTATINAHVGYKINARNRVAVEGFNLDTRQASTIDYYYTSRLAQGTRRGRERHPLPSD